MYIIYFGIYFRFQGMNDDLLSLYFSPPTTKFARLKTKKTSVFHIQVKKNFQ